MTEAARCVSCGISAELVSGACVRCIERMSIALANRRAWTARAELFAPERLSAAIATHAVGHPRAQQAIAAALRDRHIAARASLPARAPRLLFIGPPGCGKSTLARALCDLWPGPSLHADARRLSASGTTGESMEQLAAALVRVAGGDPVVAARGVLVVDSLDGSDEPRFTHLQRELLRVLEGHALEVEGWRSGQVQGVTSLPTRDLLVAVAISARTEPVLLDAFRARFDRVLRLEALDAGESRQVLDRALRAARAFLAHDGLGLELGDEAHGILAQRAAADPNGCWTLSALVRQLIESALLGSGTLRVDAAMAQRLAEQS